MVRSNEIDLVKLTIHGRDWKKVYLKNSLPLCYLTLKKVLSLAFVQLVFLLPFLTCT